MRKRGMRMPVGLQARGGQLHRIAEEEELEFENEQLHPDISSDSASEDSASEDETDGAFSWQNLNGFLDLSAACDPRLQLLGEQGDLLKRMLALVDEDEAEIRESYKELVKEADLEGQGLDLDESEQLPQALPESSFPPPAEKAEPEALSESAPASKSDTRTSSSGSSEPDVDQESTDQDNFSSQGSAEASEDVISGHIDSEYSELEDPLEAMRGPMISQQLNLLTAGWMNPDSKQHKIWKYGIKLMLESIVLEAADAAVDITEEKRRQMEEAAEKARKKEQQKKLEQAPSNLDSRVKERKLRTTKTEEKCGDAEVGRKSSVRSGTCTPSMLSSRKHSTHEQQKPRAKSATIRVCKENLDARTKTKHRLGERPESPFMSSLRESLGGTHDGFDFPNDFELEDLKLFQAFRASASKLENNSSGLASTMPLSLERTVFRPSYETGAGLPPAGASKEGMRVRPTSTPSEPKTSGAKSKVEGQGKAASSSVMRSERARSVSPITRMHTGSVSPIIDNQLAHTRPAARQHARELNPAQFRRRPEKETFESSLRNSKPMDTTVTTSSKKASHALKHTGPKLKSTHEMKELPKSLQSALGTYGADPRAQHTHSKLASKLKITESKASGESTKPETLPGSLRNEVGQMLKGAMSNRVEIPQVGTINNSVQQSAVTKPELDAMGDNKSDTQLKDVSNVYSAHKPNFGLAKGLGLLSKKPEIYKPNLQTSVMGQERRNNGGGGVSLNPVADPMIPVMSNLSKLTQEIERDIRA